MALGGGVCEAKVRPPRDSLTVSELKAMAQGLDCRSLSTAEPEALGSQHWMTETDG